MHVCYYIYSLWLLSQTNFRAEMASFRHTLPVSPLNTCVWRSHVFNVLLHDSAGTMFSVFMMPQTSRHVLYCKSGCTTVCSGWDHVANPAFAIASPTPEVTCKAITLSRLSPYKPYTACYHAKASQQVAKRSMCWSLWRPGDFQGNFFSRLCI